MVRKDGKTVRLLAALLPVNGTTGDLLRWLLVVCDLNERLQQRSADAAGGGAATDEQLALRWGEQVQAALRTCLITDASAAACAALATDPTGSPPEAVCCPIVAAAAEGVQSLMGLEAGELVGCGCLCLAGPETSGGCCFVGQGRLGLGGHAAQCSMGLSEAPCKPHANRMQPPCKHLLHAGSAMRKLMTAQLSGAAAWVKLLLYRRNGAAFWALVYTCPATQQPVVRPAAGSKPPDGGRQQPGGTSREVTGAAAAGDGARGSMDGPGSGSGGGCGGSLQLLFVIDITSQRLKRLGKYVVGKVVGQGASGVVRLGKNPVTDELVAIKTVDATRFRSLAEIEQVREGGIADRPNSCCPRLTHPPAKPTPTKPNQPKGSRGDLCAVSVEAPQYHSPAGGALPIRGLLLCDGVC